VGLTEGNIFQGELTMDQLLFNRPVPGYAQYRAPVKNLYMCGSSTASRRRRHGGARRQRGTRWYCAISDGSADGRRRALRLHRHRRRPQRPGMRRDAGACRAPSVGAGGGRAYRRRRRTREFARDIVFPAAPNLLHLMPDALLRELQLESHGLTWAASHMTPRC